MGMFEKRLLAATVMLYFGNFSTMTSVHAKPVIVEEAADVTVFKNGNVTLRCVVKGLPSDGTELLPVLWTRDHLALLDGRNISYFERYTMVGNVSAGEHFLHIENVQEEDDAFYDCQIVYYFVKSRAVKVTVLVPPDGPYIDGLNEIDMTFEVVADRQATVTCLAYNGKPPASLKWYKEGVIVNDGVTVTVSQDSGTFFKTLYNSSATLRFTPTRNDIGVRFTCQMSGDSLKRNHYQSFRLKFLELPSVSVVLPQSIQEGHAMMIACRAAHTHPPVMSYRWFVDGHIQPDEVRRTFVTSRVERTWHKKRVGCQGRNRVGYSPISVDVLNVLYAPILLSSSPVQVVNCGDDVTMWCLWESNPDPVVVWVKNSNNSVVGKGSNITLHGVSQSDHGLFQCIAVSGEVSMNAANVSLLVRGPPVLFSSNVQCAELDYDVVIKCTVNSFPRITDATWSWSVQGKSFTLRGSETLAADGGCSKLGSDTKYQGIIADGGHSSSLLVTGVQQQDLHTYSCTVTNSYGSNSKEYSLKGAAACSVLPISEVMFAMSAIAGALLITVVSVAIVWCVKQRRQRRSTSFAERKENRCRRGASWLCGFIRACRRVTQGFPIDPH